MNTKTVSPDIVVQEEGKSKVLIFVHLPELRVKRAFPKLLRSIPSNGEVKILQFERQSLKFTIDIGTKSYAISVARLPGEIEPDRCSLKYQRGACWIKLKKSDVLPWMGKICDSINPGLDKQDEIDDEAILPSAPLKEPDEPMSPLAPSPSVRSSTKKTRAPPPPFQEKRV